LMSNKDLVLAAAKIRHYGATRSDLAASVALARLSE
jgi:hypothetical protein